ncbi:branched-chain amino acid ABC transporter permease [Halovivax cerinus]|uniref:Branched-chain amino acid ABC transporter permease n=1 Tax=Halovivax cerinus TaxID=1487865 RepID=A0ABD5NNX6_9EURY|nr:branched-chain amino acid ABC transporter permease [Halovivax cerinus]
MPLSRRFTDAGVGQTLRRNYVEAIFVGFVALLGVDLLFSLATGSLPLSRFATYVWDGLIIGLALGLAGIGLSLTYSILGFANVAHGDTITTGAFIGWGVTFVLFGFGDAAIGELLLLGVGGDLSASDLGITLTARPLAVAVGLVLTAAITAGLSLGLDRYVFEPLRDATSMIVLIASVGVAFLLRYALVFFYKPSQRSLVAQPETAVFGTADGVPVIAGSRQALQNGEAFVEIPVAIGSGTNALLQVNAHQLLLVAVAIGLMIGLHVLLQRTKLGKSMRAMADNDDLARTRGIPTERVIRWTWVIGGTTSGVAGFLIVLERGTMSFQFGWLLLLLIFAAVVLGGIGSIYGAIVGGIIVGLTTTVSLVWLPEATFARPVAFLIMILVLVVRPKGLFGGRVVG